MRRYPEYKNSGVEWLGEIPFEWDTIKIKFTDKLIMGQSPESKDVTDFEKGIPFLQGNAEFTDTHPTPKNWCIVPNKTANKNDILLSVRAPVGEINIADQTYGIGRGLCAIRPKKNLLKYLYYILSISKEELNKVSTGTTFVAITIPNLSNVIIPKVGIIEQQSIVNFLDYKTNQIDQFIANRQRQIELLKEQKVSIINFAITRGTDKNVKLKKSETLTLDFYPEHWKLTKIKYLLKKKRAAIRTGPFGTQLKNSDLREDGEIKIYNQRSVIDKNFIGGTEYISLEKYEGLKDFTVNPNDLLITTRGTIGKCAIFPDSAEIGVLHPCLIRMQLDTRIISNEYAMICLENALYFQEEIKLLSNSTVIEVIYSYNLKEVFLPIPPTLKEQQEILKYIKEETSNVENLSSKYQKQIDLMQEYRTSLISQAVTGKIDVRDWKPKSKK